MMRMPYLYLIAAFSINAAANIFLKLGSQKGIVANVPLSQMLFANWQFVVGVMLFAINVFFYFLALRALPLSIAYPTMVVMSFALVNAYALTMLGEQITVMQIFGYVLLALGLVFIIGYAR